jgi:hypothetical protein
VALETKPPGASLMKGRVAQVSDDARISPSIDPSDQAIAFLPEMRFNASEVMTSASLESFPLVLWLKAASTALDEVVPPWAGAWL